MIGLLRAKGTPLTRNGLIVRPRSRGLRCSVVLASLALAAPSIGCRRAQAQREWRPEDHDNDPNSGQAAVPQKGSSPAGATPDLARTVDAVWNANCVPCHGLSGHGDGPNGPMVKAADLAGESTQGKTDAELLQTIRAGKGRMPGNPGIPQNVIAGLVAKVRSFH